MGERLRHYWMPCLPSIELSAPDSPPRKVRLLGENLIAFRDGASLLVGRNEAGGLRCSYHGWTFDVTVVRRRRAHRMGAFRRMGGPPAPRHPSV